MAEVATLVIEVASGAIDKASSQLRQLSTSAHEAETATSALSGAFAKLGAIMAGLELYEAAKNTVMLAARYETLGATLRVMSHNAGVTTEAMLGYQKALEDTGISAIKARGALQIMAAAQLDLEKSAKLGRVAQDAATLAGINSSDAFNNLVRGISTGEVRIIRHMGIMANFTVAHKKYADQLGKNVESLTADERATARLLNVLEEGSKRAGVYEAAMTTAGKQILSMQRYTENLQVQIGELFNPATNAIVFELVRLFKEASDALKEWKDSGDMGVFANSISEKLSGVFSVVTRVVKALWEWKEAIALVGAAYAASRLGAWVSELTNKSTLWYASINQGAAIRQNELRDVINTTAALRANAAARLLDIEAQISAAKGPAGNLAYSPALDSQRASAQRAFNATVRDGVAAQNALAEATKNTSAAKAVFGQMLGALGGWVGVAITALAALGYAYYELRDKVLESADDTAKATRKGIEELEADGVRLFEYYRLLNAGQFKAAESHKKMTEAMSSPAVRKVDEEIKELNKHIKELMDPTAWEHWKAKLQDAMLSLGGLAGIAVRIFKGDEVINRIGDNNDRLKLLTSQRTNTIKMLLQNKDLQKGIDDTPKAKAEAEEKEQKSKFIAWQKEINKLKENQNILEMQGLGYTKEEVEAYKAKEDLYRKIADVWESTRLDGNSKQAKYTKEQALALEDELIREWQARDAAIKRNAENERGLAIAKLQKKAAEENSGTLENLEKELIKLTSTERDRYVQETQALILSGMTQEAIDERIKKYDELAGKIKQQVELNEESSRIENLGVSLNKRHKEDEERLADLNKLKAQGKLIEGVYEKAWFEVMMKGDSAMAYIVQSTSKLFDTLGGYLGDLFTGTSTSFRDMISKMMADLARFFASEAMKKLLMIGIGMFTGGSGGGSDWAGTSSTSGKASGGPVTGGVAYTVGEQGPELFVPGASGTIIPNNMMNAGSSGGDTTISITVNMEEGKKDNVTSSSDTGRQTGLLIASAVRAVIIDEKRPGGLLFAGA